MWFSGGENELAWIIVGVALSVVNFWLQSTRILPLIFHVLNITWSERLQ
jgi:hypothetical protein